jgi:CDP-diacylglycerol--serine O-phosphatidyltransferase
MKTIKRFQMIREFHLADWFTLGNAACGIGALFSMIPLAMVFDVLDGRIARWRQKASAMGRELDSLADVISFGVAPAAIAYAAGMDGLWDRIVLVYFVACGVSRLARYNITTETLSQGGDKVKYFEGTPIPTSLLLVFAIGIAAVQGQIGGRLWLGMFHLGPWQLHPFVLAFAVSGSLMISRLRIPKL